MPLGLARSTTSSGAMSIPPGSTIQLEAWAMNSDHTITSTTYTPSSDLPSMCLASMPAQVGPTATPTATARPTGFVTSTPLAIGTLTPTPSPSPSPTPTGTILAPTAIPTATPIPTNTLVPFPFPTNTTPIGPPPPPPGASSPTATATTVPTATSTAIPPPRLKGWTRIVYKVVRPDTREEVEVHTLRGVKVSMRVVYPDKLSTYSAHGTAGTAGIWRAAWSIVTLQGGTARVRFTLRLGSQIRVLNRHFRID